jgi:hypothetical protein
MRIRKSIADAKVPSLSRDALIDSKGHKKCPHQVLLRRVCLWISAVVGFTIVQSRIFVQLRGDGGITYGWSKVALLELQDFLIKFRRTKPRIYIDIGPYKTGTSFLQCALSRNAYEILKQDNVRLRRQAGYRPRLEWFSFLISHERCVCFYRCSTLERAMWIVSPS